MSAIQEGAMVKHKTKILLNGGLAFTVLELNEDMALCEYFDTDPEQTIRKEWFNVSDLILINNPEGGFFS